MANRSPLTTNQQKRVVQTTWTGLLNGDVGIGENLTRFDNVTVQVLGTFGAGGSISIEGSNDGGTTWAIINDTRGESNVLTFTTADVRSVNERPTLMRPHVTAGDGSTSLTVIATAMVSAK